MKIGKVSQTVLKRALMKPLQFHREDVLWNPTIEEMCYGITVQPDEQCIATDTVLYGDEKDLGVFALAQVINDLATRGARTVGVSVRIMLPPHAYESRLKAMVEYVEQAASAHMVQVISAQAEVNPAITKAVVFMNGMGVVKKGELLRSNMGKPDQDIVLLKWIGLEGTFRVLREKEDVLSHRFVPTFLKQVRALEPEIFSEKAIELARKTGVSAMHQIAGGGILAALWEMTEASKVGMEVDLKKMAIRQETVEICEFCHLNPYQLTSIGSVLMFAQDGERLVEALRKEGIQAELLGRTMTDTAKVILGGEEKRFLDRPAPDELLQLYSIE